MSDAQPDSSDDMILSGANAAQQLVMPDRVNYAEVASVSPEGLGMSRERSVWPHVPRRPHDEELLDVAARIAARAYGTQIHRMFFGILGPGENAPEFEPDERVVGPEMSLYVKPFGLRILEVMGFGALHSGERLGEYYHGVERGLLATHGAERMGSLYFRWQREGDAEVFETEVRDFTPRIARLGGSWLGRRLYALTQLNMHRLVMWRYHVWVQRHRKSLLGEAAGELSRRRRVAPKQLSHERAP